MKLINLITKIMDEKRISQKELCNSIGISTSTFSNWKIRQTDPPVKYIVPICNCLGVSHTDLISESQNEDENSNIATTFNNNTFGNNNVIASSNSNANVNSGFETEFYTSFNNLSFADKAKVIALVAELSEGEKNEKQQQQTEQ
jgi:DNA-binding Xre family transcriptional regulator